MNPVRLELRDFTSYVHESVDLSRVRVASLVGPNGSGKSSLIEAMVWALYGEGPKGGKKAASNYVRAGKDRCSVELEFLLGGEEYRIARSWDARRSRSSLELFRREGGEWRAISGKTVAETQSAIERLLRMDYKTFTSSVLALQGEFDSFTRDGVTDQQRKEILASILGLEVWDEVQQEASSRLRAARAVLQSLQSDIDRLRAAVSERPGVEAELAAVEASAREGEGALLELRRRLNELEKEAAVLEDRKKRLEELSSQVQRLRSRRSEVLSEVSRQVGLRKADIERFEEDLRLLSTQLSALDELIASRDEVLAAALEEDSLRQELSRLEGLRAKSDELKERLADAQRRESAWRSEHVAELSRLEAVVGEVRKKSSLLGEVPCSGEAMASCPLLVDARCAAKSLDALEGELEAARAASSPVASEIASIDAELGRLGYDAAAHRQITARLKELEPLARRKSELDAAEGRRAEIEERIASCEARIREMEKELASLQSRASLEASRYDEEIQVAEAALVEAQESAKLWEEARDGLEAARRALEAKEAEVAALRERLGMLRQRAGELQRAQGELERALEAFSSKEREERVCAILEKAAGKRFGVPAFIMEHSLPQIERIAGELLARVTGGRLALRFETQLEAKTSGAVQEVFRPYVLDGAQERPYQTFSGAEKLLVDLALRVAISKFLASRAGAEIRLLVIDEGLSALDEANRQEVVSAILELSKDFDKVIVVSHIAELQEALPEKLVVERTPGGSKVRMTL